MLLLPVGSVSAILLKADATREPTHCWLTTLSISHVNWHFGTMNGTPNRAGPDHALVERAKNLLFDNSLKETPVKLQKNTPVFSKE